MERLLIAERGEAAVRIARTAKRLGITTIALRSATDPSDALHLDACDEAQLAPDDPKGLPDAVQQCGADAVHPGYAGGAMHPLVTVLEAAGIPTVSAPGQALGRCADAETVAAAADRAGLRPVPAEGLDRPRRLDMVVAADRQDTVAPLGELELLVRSDGPPLLVESPAPALLMRHDGEAAREAMGEAAGRLLLELGVTGVASVHFLFDMDGRLWLSGITPGLPALHAPLEMAGELDLLEVDLRVVGDEPLSDDLFKLQPHGHAFAVRVETGDERTQEVTDLRWPPAPHGRIRADVCAQVGAIPEAPLLVKLASFSPIRHQALLTLDRVLAATAVAPYATNTGALRQVLGNESFRASQYDVGFVTRATAAT
jgi:acetyl/propionyl-CoA carboxylase alpha subunit